MSWMNRVTGLVGATYRAPLKLGAKSMHTSADRAKHDAGVRLLKVGSVAGVVAAAAAAMYTTLPDLRLYELEAELRYRLGQPQLQYMPLVIPTSSSSGDDDE